MPLHPSLPMDSERAGLEIMRTGELSLPLTSCNIWESDPCDLLGQYSRAGSGGVIVGEIALGH